MDDFGPLNGLAATGDIKDHVHTLYGIVRGFRPQTILEIGVRHGVSTSALTLAARYYNGHVYSMDINPCIKAAERIKRIGTDKWWTFFEGDSQDIGWDRLIDLLFIDGDHSFEGVKKDFTRFFPFVRENGLILMHDAYCPSEVIEREKVAVHKFVDMLKNTYYRKKLDIKNKLEIATLPYCNGLTIIRKVPINEA